MSWNSSSDSLIWQVMNFLAPEDGRFGYNYAPWDLYFICNSNLFKRLYLNQFEADLEHPTFCGIAVIVNDEFNFNLNDYQIVLKDEYDSGNIEHIWIIDTYSYI